MTKNELERLATIEAKIDNIIEGLEPLKCVPVQIAGHEQRISSLESAWRSISGRMWVVLGGILVGLVLWLLPETIRHIMRG